MNLNWYTNVCIIRGLICRLSCKWCFNYLLCCRDEYDSLAAVFGDNEDKFVVCRFAL